MTAFVTRTLNAGYFGNLLSRGIVLDYNYDYDKEDLKL